MLPKPMSEPFPLSLSYCIYQSSFISNHCQYFLICDLFSPAEFSSFPIFPIFTFRKPPVFYILFSHNLCLSHTGHYIAVFLPFAIKFRSLGSSVLFGMLIFLSLFVF